MKSMMKSGAITSLWTLMLCNYRHTASTDILLFASLPRLLFPLASFPAQNDRPTFTALA
jgi:hypothetical protein